MSVSHMFEERIALGGTWPTQLAVKRELDLNGIFPSLAVCDRLAARLVDLARHNHHRLVSA